MRFLNEGRSLLVEGTSISETHRSPPGFGVISQEMCQAAAHGTNNALVKAESMRRDRSNSTFSGVCIRSHMSPENVPFCKGTDPAIASPVGAHRRLGLDRGGKARGNDCRKTDGEGEDEGDAT